MANKLLAEQLAKHIVLGDVRMQLFKQVQGRPFSTQPANNTPFKQASTPSCSGLRHCSGLR